MKKNILLFLSILFCNVSNSEWHQLSSYPSSNSQKLLFVNNYLFSCSLNGGAYRSTDDGISWVEINNGLVSADSKKSYDLKYISGKLYLATVDGIYASSDNGDNWERKSTGLTIGPGANNVFAFSIFENEEILYSGTWNGIYYSTDFSETWNLCNISGQGVNIVSFIKFNGQLYAGRDAINNPALYRSSDAGMNWTSVNVWNNFPISVFCFFPEGDSLFVGTGHGMWFSSNNGVNWTGRSIGLSPDPYVSSIVKTGNTMIASLRFGGSGVYRSFNNGILWVDISDNLPFLNDITQLIIYDNKVYAATSEKIWYRNLNDIITGINPTGNLKRDDYSLSQNYPNPFNPKTTINYELGISGYITLKIFDIRGKEIQTLVNEKQNAGGHKVEFDGADLPSGIYYYSFKTNNHNETKKMLLIK